MHIPRRFDVEKRKYAEGTFLCEKRGAKMREFTARCTQQGDRLSLDMICIDVHFGLGGW